MKVSSVHAYAIASGAMNSLLSVDKWCSTAVNPKDNTFGLVKGLPSLNFWCFINLNIMWTPNLDAKTQQIFF